MTVSIKLEFISVLFLLMLANIAEAQMKIPEEEYEAPKKEYSPYVAVYYPQNVYFGDTHLHTSWSVDAGMGGATLGPEEAYRASRGETVITYSGQRFKLIRPLDFLVVADHAENLGLADFIRRSDPIILANKKGKEWHDLVKAGKGYQAYLEWFRADDVDLINEPHMARAVWEHAVENADKYYRPGSFTTFAGFEWTSHPGGNNLHRVVVFRDASERTLQVLPYSQYDSIDPEDLWEYMANYEKITGGRVLAIPHNGNFSNGLMFDVVTLTTNKPLTKDYAERRSYFEPIIEVTQIKGDAETHPLLSPNDEFADFETMDKGNLSGKEAKTDDMLAREYARYALREGMRLESEIGANPFKFGLIGSTDAHGAVPTTREENFWNKGHIAEPGPDRVNGVLVQGEKPELSINMIDVGAQGLAAVWATENTREAIWDAMARKEVYATTGTRLRVRVFAGWDFEKDEVHRPDFAREGYKRGVPMGGDLRAGPEGASPTFMVRALKDPDGANLDRIQIIKGWLDADGKTHERIYDVAVSGDRVIGPDGRAKESVGNTVDLANATYTNDIGSALLLGYWKDPEFDPALRAFYYVRVIEIPTPRWTAYDAKFFNIDMPEGTAMEVTDRAYTSPIWYTP